MLWPMLIDCDTCLARDMACNECVVNFIFHEGLLDLDEDEADALTNLAEAGLVPQLRLVVPGDEGLPNPLSARVADQRGA